MKLHKRPITKKQDLKLVFLTEEKCFTTSLIVAEIFEKEQYQVMRDIRVLLQQLKSVGGCLANFVLTSRKVDMPNGGVKSEPYYEMDRDAFSLLVMGFTGEKALKWKLKFLEAFNGLCYAAHSHFNTALKMLQIVIDKRIDFLYSEHTL